MKRATKADAGLLKTSRAVAACSILPWFITTTRSASAIASSWLWVTWMKLMPSRVCRLFSSSRMRTRRKGSSADNGSSSSSTCGSVISARASATRCCWPPESCAGSRAAKGSIWTRFSMSRARERRVSLSTPRMRRLKATLSVQSRCGNSA